MQADESSSRSLISAATEAKTFAVWLSVLKNKMWVIWEYKSVPQNLGFW